MCYKMGQFFSKKGKCVHRKHIYLYTINYINQKNMVYRKNDIECVLNRINKTIEEYNFNFTNSGFLEGNLGYCLYYYYCYLLLNNDSFIDKLSFHLEKSINDINENNVEHYSPSHIVEIGRLLAFFVSEKILDYTYLDEFVQSSESIVYTYLSRKVDDVNFDSIDGIISTGNYLLDLYELEDKKTKESIELIVKIILENVLSDKNHYYWRFNFRDRKNPFIELGIFHGMAGIVYFLSRIIKNHVCSSELVDIVQGACDFMLSCQGNNNKFLFPLDSELKFGFPNSINLAYGDIGIGYALKTAGITINSSNIRDRGQFIIDRCANYKDSSNNEIRDAEFIYGASGLLSFFDNISTYEEKDRYKLPITYWIDKILYFGCKETRWAGFETYMNGFREDVQYSFSHGLIGIATVLMCYYLNLPHKYLKLFSYESYIYKK